MQLPTHKKNWRERWECITAELEILLEEELPDPDALISLLKDRQRLLVAFQRVSIEESELSFDQQRDWVEAMLERDQEIIAKVSDLLENRKRALICHKGNKSLQKRLRRNEISPQRHYVLTGHL